MSLLKRIAASLVLSVLIVTSLSRTGIAQQASGGSGLNITPTRSELSVQQGSTGVVKINLQNIASGDVIAQAEVDDFEADDQTGNPRLIVDKTKTVAASIKPFLVGINDVPLKKGERKDITINIEVPKEAAPGAYYGIVRYTAVPADQGVPKQGTVALNASLGTIILLEIPGNITQRIQVLSLQAMYNKTSGSFFTHAPNKMAINIQNLGNGFAKPFGKVNVTDLRGHQVDSYEINSKEPRGNVLPSSNRVFTDDIHGIKIPGRYTATASVSATNGGEVLIYKSVFWYIPTWCLIVIAVLVLGLGVGGYIVYRRRYGGRKRRRRQ